MKNTCRLTTRMEMEKKRKKSHKVGIPTFGIVCQEQVHSFDIESKASIIIHLRSQKRAWPKC